MKTWIKRRPFLWAGLALVLLPGLVISATASSGSPAASVKARAVTPNVSGTFRDGPYTATTPDSGTCGNNWAIDLFARQFVIFPQNADGSWKVVENFRNGRFITLGNGETGQAESPGACDGHVDNGHRLREGVIGTFNGSFTIKVNTGFTYTANQGCGSDEGGPGGASTDDGCTTANWLARAFPGATYPGDANVTTFSLTYNAPSAAVGGKTWTNADPTNSGDIFTS